MGEAPNSVEGGHKPQTGRETRAENRRTLIVGRLEGEPTAGRAGKTQDPGGGLTAKGACERGVGTAGP